MIDEYWTWKFYGYHSDDLSTQSNKPIVMKCDGCCQYRIGKKQDYRDFCVKCVQKGKKRPPFTNEHLHNMSVSAKNKPPITEYTRLKMSISCKNRPPLTDETRAKLSEANTGENNPAFGKPWSEARRHAASIQRTGKKKPPRTLEWRKKRSAYMQGVPYEEWTGFSSNGEYCEKFDEACRERIRDKYNHRCFMCDKPQSENITKNGNQRALAVHHYDMNKEQGCNGVEWKLVPLCMSCHSKSHSVIWMARIEYLLEHLL